MNTQDTKSIRIASLQRYALRATVALGMMFGPAGCDEDGDLDEAAIDDETMDPSEVSPRGLMTSEEYAPATCGSASEPLLAGIDCSGSYCDDISLFCDKPRTLSHPLPLPPPPTVGASTWSTWFSEEGAANNLNSRKCSGTTWMTGIKCRGSYCDEVSIRCSEIFDGLSGNPHSPFNCAWSDWYSEEDYFIPSEAPNAYNFIRGVKCQGSYCDQMAYYICRF